MLPEYDFASLEGGVRGKYAKPYRKGRTVEIRKAAEQLRPSISDSKMAQSCWNQTCRSTFQIQRRWLDRLRWGARTNGFENCD